MIRSHLRTIRLLTVVLLGVSLAPSAWSAPYPSKGHKTQWTQPDGTVLKLRVFGDDFYGRTETEDGFTVVYNPGTRAYHYATVSADGLDLNPSARMAHEKRPGGLKPHADRSAEGIRKIRQQERRQRPLAHNERWQRRVQSARALRGAVPKAAPGPNFAPVTGTIRGLTILAEFPDDKRTNGNDAVKFPTNRAKIVRFCNTAGYTEDGNTGSVRDYFTDQSNGQLTYIQKVTPVIVLPRPRNFYNFSDYPTNNVFRGAGQSGRLLLADALEVLKSQNFDFSGLTTDTSGRVLATNIFFAGQDSGVWAAGLWPHQFSLSTPVDVGNGAAVYAYQITNLENASPVIGTFCHENGHLILDYPDLYDYGGESAGVGEHCLMGSGNYRNDGKTPAPINAYFKDIVGWAKITDLASTDNVTEKLPSTGNVAYRIRKPGSLTEHFVVENRGNGDRWAAHAVDKGIAVWHVDEAVTGNDDEQMTEFFHYQVSLEQADGNFDLERGFNRGDVRDLFDIGGTFSSTSLPNSNWWDGTNSGVRVRVLSSPGAKVNVRFGTLPPNTIIVGDPAGGQLLYRGSQTRITWEANISGNVKIDLFRNGSFVSEIAANVPNNGVFFWTVPEKQKPGSNFRVRISSVTNPVPTFDDSDAPFAITDSTFPVSNSMPHGWHKPKGADAGWEVTKDGAFEGKFCLASRPIPDGGRAAVAYTSNFIGGTVSFYLKVSSEPGYDHARFFIDGVPQPILDSPKGLSGVRGWTFVSVPLSAGKHTLMWTYDKDDSYGDGLDKAWLDAVQLPATRQEIAIQSSAGAELESEVSSFRFSETTMGRKSPPRTFTIKNSGKADLTGISLRVVGDGKQFFEAAGPGKKVLKPGESTTFTVRFAPQAVGAVAAMLHVLSNDVDESPFIINMAGTGKGVPKLAVYQPASDRLRNDQDTLNFGITSVGGQGRTRSVTLRNLGKEPLRVLAIKKKGAGRKDFRVGKPGATVLAPGGETTLAVTFVPRQADLRSAKLIIRTNDHQTGQFQITLKGKGAPRRKASAPAHAALLAAGPLAGGTPSSQSGASSVTLVDGAKYRTLTVEKAAIPGGLKPVVEVSGNLLDWYRGDRHTTVVKDNASTLKVRDNTPLEPGVKRYIRLRLLDR